MKSSTDLVPRGTAIRSNVALNVEKLKSTGPILNAAADNKKIRVVGGVYELRTGRASSC